MPKGKVTRYKKIHCKTCSKLVKTFDREKYVGYHVTQEDIMEAIRLHYKRHHPKRLREMYER